MDLQTTSKVIAEMLQKLDLNPKTVPEDETLVESFIVRNYINSDCVRVNLGGNDFFRIEGESEAPCIDVTIQSDDTVNGPGDVLCFTYYGGDNILMGPRHGLVVTNLTTKTLLYWREPRQNPATEWRYNLFARAQVGFKFNSQGSDSRFMTQQSLYEFMRETPVSGATHPTVAEYLKIDGSSQLLAEVAYLNFWNSSNKNAPAEEGIDFNVEFDYANDTAIIIISCDHREDIEAVTFLYAIDPEAEPHPNYYELSIIDGDNAVYDRGFDQNEVSAWDRNSMANDPFITDENGNALFIGDPIPE